MTFTNKNDRNEERYEAINIDIMVFNLGRCEPFMIVVHVNLAATT